VIISITLSCYISMGQEIPEVTAAEFPDYSLIRNDRFDGKSLWGYMNGGADIYLEYGFEMLRVEEFSSGEETIKLELFKMDDPISAFGIYSIKTFKCEQNNITNAPNCLNRFQFQLLFGDYYMQLINESGSEKAKQAMIDIAENLLQKIEYREIKLPLMYLTDSLNFSLNNIKMLKGDLGIQTKATDLIECFNGIEGYQIYYAKKQMNGANVKYYEIVFDKPEMKNKFLNNIIGKELQIIKENDVNILIRL